MPETPDLYIYVPNIISILVFVKKLIFLKIISCSKETYKTFIKCLSLNTCLFIFQQIDLYFYYILIHELNTVLHYLLKFFWADKFCMHCSEMKNCFSSQKYHWDNWWKISYQVSRCQSFKIWRISWGKDQHVRN